MTYRALICGSRRWRYIRTVHSSLDRMRALHGERIEVVEGHAAGADTHAHLWAEHNGLRVGEGLYCYPVDWRAEQAADPTNWKKAGPRRNTAMLIERDPAVVVAFHDQLDLVRGGTSDMCIRALLAGVPTWLVSGPDSRPRRLEITEFPKWRVGLIRQQLPPDVLRLAV